MEVVKAVCRLVSSGLVVVVGCCGRSKGDGIIVDTSCVVLGQATYELLPLVAGLDGAACCCCLPLFLLLFVGEEL